MGKSRASEKKGDKIIIDEAKNLVFSSEEELFKHFFNEISALEQEFFSLRSESDLPEEDFDKYEENLTILLEAPDEIWKDEETFKDNLVHVYIKRFENTDEGSEESLYHVAVVYLTDKIPSFVYLHFPTTSEALVGKYRRGEKLFDRLEEGTALGAIEGDALFEGDEFAKGLYQAMIKLRSESDIKEDRFILFAHLREETIEEPDEIWRNNDSMGNVLVSFIKEFPDEESSSSMYYVVVTLEDLPSGSHALLFSFPSSDEGLVARYRHGENLQAEEVVQEASH